MGVSLNTGPIKFYIDKSKIDDCLAAIKAMAIHTDKMHGGSSSGEKWFSFGPGPKELSNVEDIVEAFDLFRWEVFLDVYGSVVDIEFNGEKYGDDDFFFETIAPFVKSGSFIEAQADGDPFRWFFRQGKLKIQEGRISYR